MIAGRELDALVAEKVMGWTDRHGEFAIPPNTSPHRGAIRYMPEKVLPYSADIGSAWQVVEKLRETWAIELHGREGVWNCLVEEGDEVTAHFIATAEADTAPLAICLASLKAVGVEVESPK